MRGHAAAARTRNRGLAGQRSHRCLCNHWRLSWAAARSPGGYYLDATKTTTANAHLKRLFDNGEEGGRTYQAQHTLRQPTHTGRAARVARDAKNVEWPAPHATSPPAYLIASACFATLSTVALSSVDRVHALPAIYDAVCALHAHTPYARLSCFTIRISILPQGVCGLFCHASIALSRRDATDVLPQWMTTGMTRERRRCWRAPCTSVCIHHRACAHCRCQHLIPAAPFLARADTYTNATFPTSCRHAAHTLSCILPHAAHHTSPARNRR